MACGAVRGRRCAGAVLTSSREAHIRIGLDVHLEVELIADLKESSDDLCRIAKRQKVSP